MNMNFGRDAHTEVAKSFHTFHADISWWIDQSEGALTDMFH